jgi:hypothetical protein
VSLSLVLVLPQEIESTWKHHIIERERAVLFLLSPRSLSYPTL